MKPILIFYYVLLVGSVSFGHKVHAKNCCECWLSYEDADKKDHHILIKSNKRKRVLEFLSAWNCQAFIDDTRSLEKMSLSCRLQNSNIEVKSVAACDRENIGISYSTIFIGDVNQDSYLVHLNCQEKCDGQSDPIVLTQH